jgi:SNF2 domain-containing protein/SNF2 helicase protein/helicase-like protein
MPLVYLPDIEAFSFWGETRPIGSAAAPGAGTAGVVELVTPEGRAAVPGTLVPLLVALPALAALPSAELEAHSGSVVAWSLASKLALELVAHERVVPTIVRRSGRLEARWGAALSASEDAAKVMAIAQSMPPAAHAVPAPGGAPHDVWAPDALLRAFLDASVDGLVREARGGPALPARPRVTGKKRAALAKKPAAPQLGWAERWSAALGGDTREFEAHGFAERSVIADIERWSAPALGARDRLRACFRLELPETDAAPFVLRFLLQSPDDPSLLVSAAEVWSAHGGQLTKLGRAFRDPEESLLEALGRAARLYAPIATALESTRPEALELDAAGAWSFLDEGAAQLAEAGFGVIVPSELTAGGQRRLKLRLRLGGTTKVAGKVAGVAGLGLDELLTVNWEAALGDERVSASELAALARQKAKLVRFRGAWVAIDPRELVEIRARLAAPPGQMPVREALWLSLAGETRDGALRAEVTASGSLAALLERLGQSGTRPVPAPATLRATLRPYQERGLGWLSTMASLGLGACLADDMGLGKTIQLLAYLSSRLEARAGDRRPALLVAPTSVIGNWERELATFAPALRSVVFAGAGRATSAADFPDEPGTLVLTTYGLLRRDAALLGAVDWSVVALDEAQNIKNAASATARAARSLRASERFALTGTPVENRLAELWSILEFLNPGLLGPLETFRREVALPIERYGNEAVATRLRRRIAPFILRRLKSDPTIIDDLPPKHEMRVVCSLSREQATLYKAAVDEELRRIAETEGMERRGRVLALLSYTKQICNHPAQYLGEKGPLARRSGKLARLTEMLEEALAAADRALIFTQFRDMGDKLVEHLTQSFGAEPLYLHGGTSKAARDAMVRRFQDDPNGPRLFVLSVKAGGTGLNLTAANHVFHYDRWWNPAVEDQATDRAYRIGQTRSVQVHRLLCAGTVEEKIDALLERKRALVSSVIGAGESWITELPAGELRELFALSAGAAMGLDDAEEGA